MLQTTPAFHSCFNGLMWQCQVGRDPMGEERVCVRCVVIHDEWIESSVWIERRTLGMIEEREA
jgi:hypothetical protein